MSQATKANLTDRQNGGDNVILAAPTLDGLARLWEQVVNLPLDRTFAQHVFIISAKGQTDGGV